MTLTLLWKAFHNKKNWLFVGRPNAGWRSTVLYTLIVNRTAADLLPSRRQKPGGRNPPPEARTRFGA